MQAASSERFYRRRWADEALNQRRDGARADFGLARRRDLLLDLLAAVVGPVHSDRGKRDGVAGHVNQRTSLGDD